jgi:hypothetical protein
MNAIIDGLLAYMARTSDEQFEQDWASLEEYNKIGPEINRFIQQSCDLDRFSIDSLISEITFKNIEKNPNFNLDSFFLYL